MGATRGVWLYVNARFLPDTPSWSRAWPAPAEEAFSAIPFAKSPSLRNTSAPEHAGGRSPGEE